MKIRFPVSGGKYLESVTACGRVSAKEFSKGKKPSTDRVSVQCLTTGKAPKWFRMAVSPASNEKDAHFHIDASKVSRFGKSDPVKGDSPRVLDELWDQFLNKKIKVITTAKYALPLKKLKPDSVIGVLLGVSVGVENLTGTLTGAHYEVYAEPIVSVTWTLVDGEGGEGGVIVAEIESFSETTIVDGYLDSLMNPIRDAFNTLILEQETE
jgi:hypothetical protein